MIALLHAMVAYAIPITVCADYQVDFVDSSVGGTETYFATNANQDALGLRIVLTRNGFPATTYQAYAGTSGSQAGCVSFNVPGAGATYKVTAHAQVRSTPDHDVFIRKGNGGAGHGNVITTELAPSLTPLFGHTYNYVLPQTNPWQTLAAAGRALTRNRGGRPSLALDIYVAPKNGSLQYPAACSGNGSCLDGTDLWVAQDDIERKFRIAYFMGWAILQDMGFDRSALDRTGDDSHCHINDSSLTFGNVEKTITGFLEGYAYWYAATTFNGSNDADCSFTFWEDANWDQLEVCHEEEEAAAGHVMSCSVGPKLPPYEQIVPDADYRAYCFDQREPELNPIPSDTVVPLDVVRFLRDRDRNGNLTRDDIGDVFETAVGITDPSIFRLHLRTVAVSLGTDGTEWEVAEEEHGLEH